MATDIKVQGKTIQQCIEYLKQYSEQYKVEYKATFGLNLKEYIIRPRLEKPKESIYLSFMWRHEYKEYDNSL